MELERVSQVEEIDYVTRFIQKKLLIIKIATLLIVQTTLPKETSQQKKKRLHVNTVYITVIFGKAQVFDANVELFQTKYTF